MFDHIRYSVWVLVLTLLVMAVFVFFMDLAVRTLYYNNLLWFRP